MTGSRLIVFDILRILAACMVLFIHITDNMNILIPSINLVPFFVHVGNIGVLIFIVVSGAVLELNKKPITSGYEYLKFEVHRLLRLYPAYWMSLIFAMILSYFHFVNVVYEYPIMENPYWQFSGFMAFMGYWGAPLNPIGWCIGLFVVLYLLFPVISKAMNRNPDITFCCLIIISLVSTYYLNAWAMSTNPLGYTGFITNGIIRWFPLCNLMYFGIGIFIVNKSWYPKTTDTRGIISYLGELSFYVFLFQYWPLTMISKIGLLLSLAFTFGLAAIAMALDNWIHRGFKNFGNYISRPAS